MRTIPNQPRWFKYLRLVTITIASLALHCGAHKDNNFTYEMDQPGARFLEEITENVAKNQEVIDHLRLRIPELQAVSPLFHRRSSLQERNSTLQYSNLTNATSQCNKDLLNLALSMTNQWAQSLIETYGKPDSGSSFWPGRFDKCREFQAPKTNLFPDGFQGRYCIMTANIPGVATPIQSAICLPNNCDTNALKEDDSGVIMFLSFIPIIKDYVKMFQKISFRCVPETVSLSTGAIICVAVLCLAFGLVLIGTIYDFIQRRYKTKSLPIVISNNQSTEMKEESLVEAANGSESTESKEGPMAEGPRANDSVPRAASEETINATLVHNAPNQRNKVGQILLCFSAIKNSEAILDTSERAGQLNCLHGIRFISITWVILGHTYIFGVSQIDNAMDILKAVNSFGFQPLINAALSVDTFFLLSGFLLTYLFVKDRSKFTAKKLIPFYTHRYIRLTPVYLMVLFVYATLFNFIGQGPYWIYQNQETNLCTKYWWRNFLYINNFFTNPDMCMGWSWYLANDMQFYIISPLFLVLLKSPQRKRRYIGLGVIVALLLTSWITTALLTKLKNLGIMFNILDVNNAAITQNDIFDSIYDKPWTRIGPYLIGCLLGALYLELKGARNFLQMKWQLIIWCAAIALSLTVVYGLYKVNITPTINAFYNTFSRSAWSLAVAWVIFACLTGHGGPVDKFLSWKLWFPLSRLTYCAYLTHTLVIDFYYQTLRSPVHMTNTFVAVHYLGFTILTYGLAFVTSLLFEAPVIKLEKVLRG